MSTSYPNGIDAFTNPQGTDRQNSPDHAAQHANANDAIEAIETELGTNPRGAYADVATRLDAIDSPAASGISFSPTGSIASTDVQAALGYLDSATAKLSGGNNLSGSQTITEASQLTAYFGIKWTGDTGFRAAYGDVIAFGDGTGSYDVLAYRSGAGVLNVAQNLNPGTLANVNVATPTATGHAVTKAYVDSGFSPTGHNHSGVYDPAGSASAAVTAHVAASDPHGDRSYALGLVDDLSGVSNPSQARTNLGLGTAATAATGDFDPAGAASAAVTAHVAASDPHGDRAYALGLVDDLSGVSNPTTARTNLGLGGAAVLNVGTTAGTVAAGDHNHTGTYDPAGTAAALVDDLSGVTDAATARSNLGLGSASVMASGAFAASGHTHTASQVTDFTTAVRNVALPSTGGTVSGNVTVNGTLAATGAITQNGTQVELQSNKGIASGYAELDAQGYVPIGRDARRALLVPSGALTESLNRYEVSHQNLAAALVSAQLMLWAIPLEAGWSVSSVTFWSGSTAVSAATNQWAALFNASRVALAVSSDATTAAWAANSSKTFSWTAYPVPTTALYYVGLMVKATTVPSLAGVSDGVTAVANATPALALACDTGQSTPVSVGFTAAAGSAKAQKVYFSLA